MKNIINFLTTTLLLITSFMIIINLITILSTKNRIIELEDKKLEEFDCVLVLGAGIRQNRPSPMLEDRLLKSIDIYMNQKVKKVLVSGDHTKEDYDEVNVMKTYLMEKNIPSEDIFMDHAGISTYDSIYRAKKIFKANKIIIVTQKYHMYRALYIANQLDIEAYGIIANENAYSGQKSRDIREVLARIKDYIKCIIKPESKYLGEVFSIKGNGNVTNDK